MPLIGGLVTDRSGREQDAGLRAGAASVQGWGAGGQKEQDRQHLVYSHLSEKLRYAVYRASDAPKAPEFSSDEFAVKTPPTIRPQGSGKDCRLRVPWPARRLARQTTARSVTSVMSIAPRLSESVGQHDSVTVFDKQSLLCEGHRMIGTDAKDDGAIDARTCAGGHGGPKKFLRECAANPPEPAQRMRLPRASPSRTSWRRS